MVVTAGGPALVQGLIVPDEQTWTMSGTDPVALGLRPAFAPGAAERLLVPDVLPAALSEALQACLDVLPEDVAVETRVLSGLEGRPVAAVLTREERDEAVGHELHAEHATHRAADDAPGSDLEMHGAHHEMHGAQDETHPGHHEMHGDHGDMMAIVGEPSADGLVMEPIELRFGPLGTPLPGGLAVDVTLDGDVVSESTAQALLGVAPSTEGAPWLPDLLAPVASALAMQVADEGEPGVSAWRGLAALEVERAVSHLAWLRSLGRLLGWPLLVDRCVLALVGLPPLAHALAQPREKSREETAVALSVLQRASPRAREVLMVVGGSRSLRLRATGLGVVTPGRAQQVGLRGPVARASGIRDDARAGNPLYERLGFEPVLHTGGDAHARTLVRAEEARQSLRLACAALQADVDGTPAAVSFAATGETVEGPRGPLHAERGPAGWQLAAPGAEEALHTAGESMLEAEWSDALVALASFDLSPWSVGA